MSTGLIPGPHVREHDDSFFSGSPGLIRNVVYGTAGWGPMGTKTSFVSPSGLVTTHGKPKSLQMLSAMAMVRAPMTLDFVRITDGTEAKSAVTIVHGITSIFTATAKYDGTEGDELRVVVSASSSGVASKINIQVYMYGVIAETYVDIDGFTTLEALNSAYVVFEEAAGAPAWPADWSSDYDTYDLTGGADGDTAPDMSAYVIGTPTTGPVAATGLYLYRDVSTDEVDLILTPGYSEASVVNASIALSEYRDDSTSVVDAPDNLGYMDLKDWHNGSYPGGPTLPLNSSFGVLCYPWLQYYDEYSSSYSYLPASVGFAIAAAYTWNDNGHPYASPANYESAKMPSWITGLRYNPPDDALILTYDTDGQNVNWFKNWAGYGITLWGQKTLYRANSALNRMNVRFTLNSLKRRLKRDTRIFSFKNNNSVNQKALEAFVKGILNTMVGVAISEFRVLCDDNINTAQVKQENKMVCRVFVKPLTAAEWLFFDLFVSSQSAVL